MANIQQPISPASVPSAGVPPLATGSPSYVIAYNSAAIGLKMWVNSVGVDPAPGDEFGRNIRGANKLQNAHVFTHDFALEMLPKVREVHIDAWIERTTQIRHERSEAQ